MWRKFQRSGIDLFTQNRILINFPGLKKVTIHQVKKSDWQLLLTLTGTLWLWGVWLVLCRTRDAKSPTFFGHLLTKKHNQWLFLHVLSIKITSNGILPDDNIVTSSWRLHWEEPHHQPEVEPSLCVTVHRQRVANFPNLARAGPSLFNVFAVSFFSSNQYFSAEQNQKLSFFSSFLSHLGSSSTLKECLFQPLQKKVMVHSFCIWQLLSFLA